MERYSQNHAHILQRYLIIAIEVLLLYYGIQFTDFFITGNPGAMMKSEMLVVYIYILSWVGGGMLTNYYSFEALYQPGHLFKPGLGNLGILGVISLVLYNSHPEFFPESWVKLSAGILLVMGGRSLLGFIYRHRRVFFSLAGGHPKVMIVGAGETANELNRFFQQVKGSKVYQYFDKEYDEFTAVQKLRNEKEEFHQVCLDREVNEIYYTLPLEATDVIEEIADFADNHYIHFKVANDFNLRTKHRDISVAFFNHTPIISLRKDPLAQLSNRIIKRVFDVVFSTLVLTLVMPWLLLIIGLAIRLNSKGPIFFLQKRSGRKNRPFTCFKFRTMYVQKPDENAVYKQATKNDPRITKVGAFLRKTNLDEFPQFINVFLGHMSVVGPRPHPAKLNDQYVPLIKKYPYRYFITPGITGHAQVNGYRGETKDPVEMKKRVEYDAWYIENWSFLLDLKIVLKTLFRMSTGDENAY